MSDCDCVRVYELLNELGTLMLKRKCIALSNAGYSREEINVMLDETLVPELNAWVADVMQGFTHEPRQRHTLN
jgi:hypothetical protein